MNLFQMKNMTANRKTHLIWNLANIVVFSSKDLTQQNTVPLKTCILHHFFQVFMLKCVHWLSKTFFVKMKINVDIILSEITFDNGVEKRWVAYFLNLSHLWSGPSSHTILSLDRIKLLRLNSRTLRLLISLEQMTKIF